MGERARRVVAAVIIRSGRVLLTQRDPARSDYGWLWESPGGKVELGVSNQDALVRELSEELGVTSTMGAELAAYDMSPDGAIWARRPVHVTLFAATISDTPMPLQAIGIGWFCADDVMRLALMPANFAYREQLSTRLLGDARSLVGA